MGAQYYMFETREQVIKAGDQAVRDKYLRLILDIASNALERYPDDPEQLERSVDDVVSLACYQGLDSFLRMVLRCTDHLESWQAKAPIDPEDWLRAVCHAAMMADVRAELERLCGPPED